MALSYALLLLFVCACGILITLPLYVITNHTWVSCFILGSVIAVFALENASLLKDARLKDDENSLLRCLHNEKLLYKIAQMETELSYLRKQRDKNLKIITTLKHKNHRSNSI